MESIRVRMPEISNHLTLFLATLHPHAGTEACDGKLVVIAMPT
jgi:hypothetical protein